MNNSTSSHIPEGSHIMLNSYNATEQRVKLKWIGLDPAQTESAEVPSADIRQQRLAEKFVKNCADILCTIDTQGRFINVSAASKQILGYTPDKMEGRYINDFIHQDDIDKTHRMRYDVA